MRNLRGNRHKEFGGDRNKDHAQSEKQGSRPKNNGLARIIVTQSISNHAVFHKIRVDRRLCLPHIKHPLIAS